MHRSICHDPKDNPYNLEEGTFHKIRLYDGQEFIGRFVHVEKETVPRYKFVLGRTISLRVSSNEFVVVETLEDYKKGHARSI